MARHRCMKYRCIEQPPGRLQVRRFRIATFAPMKTYARNILSLALALVLGLTTWTACDSSDSGGQVNGRMNLRLTDAPLDSATAVNVTIEQINLVREDGDDDDDAADSEGDDEAEAGDESIVPVYTPDTPETINLLDYQNATKTLATDAEVPEGTYSQMRLVLTANGPNMKSNWIVFESGNEAMLQTPSAQQSGYKINLPQFEVDEESDVIDLTIDFDASQSVVMQGNGRFLLKPVINVDEIEFSDGELEESEVEVAGRLNNVNTSGPTLTVEGLQFTVNDDTEFDGVDNIDGLTSFSYASVEASEASDGSYVADEVEALENEDARYSFEGTVDAVSSGEITVLGTAFQITQDTAFEGDLDADTFASVLTQGDAVEVEFTLDNGTRVATNVELD
jgi:hypothetical protein